MKKFELISFATGDALASHVAGAWLDEIEKARRAGKPYGVALSGGRIAHKLFASFVEQARARKIGDRNTPALPNDVHFFWADERCVPPDDPDSNFKMARELLFAPLVIPENQIHRIRGEAAPATGVKSANEDLCRVVPLNSAGRPILDLVFLGMGEDGHVASLFPDAPAEIVNDPGPFLFIENSPKPPPRRISLSYAAIAAARQVWVLISGAGKEKSLRQSLGSGVNTPLGRVLQMRQNTLIFSQIEAGEII